MDDHDQADASLSMRKGRIAGPALRRSSGLTRSAAVLPGLPKAGQDEHQPQNAESRDSRRLR